MSATLLAQRKQEVIAKVQACIETGNRIYHMTLPRVDVRFDLKGRCAGMAGYRAGKLYVRFNTDMMLRDAWDHIINDTTPHEIAHSFCQFNRQLGRNHDAGWARVCRALGGSGARTHDEDVVHGKGTTYEYTTSTGKTVRVGDKHHKIIQAGRPLTWRKGLGTVAKESAYSIVGVAGRTLAAPVVKVPAVAVTPAQPFLPKQPAPGAWTTTRMPMPDVVVRTPAPVLQAGLSKAAMARAIMLSGHTAGRTYEQIITAIMLATGHDRQLARATYKANMAKVGITE